MKEISYAAAIEAGLEPITYRLERVGELGKGQYNGRLDALVWVASRPAIMALVTLEDGTRVTVMAFQAGRKDMPLPYAGLRLLSPGDSVVLEVDIGPRGGVRPLLRSHDPAGDPRTISLDLHNKLVDDDKRKEQDNGRALSTLRLSDLFS